MTTPYTPYSCDQFAETLADFLEHDIEERTRAAMEVHALACADCGALLADLRALRVAAANMPALTPSRDLWAGIAQRIETPVVELKPGSGELSVGSRGGMRRRQLWLGLAAAGLVGVTATVTHELTKRSIGASAAVQAASTGTPNTPSRDTAPGNELGAATVTASASSQTPAASAVDSASGSRRATAAPSANRMRLASARLSPEQTYDSEIAQLRAVLEARRPQLDSSTVAVVEKNLKIIDDAIAQCRLALKKDPASRFLIESLNDAMDTKVQLLRTAAALPSRS